jgi:hypothetical protein
MGDLGQKLFNKRPMDGKASTGKYKKQEWERNLKMASYLCLTRYFSILLVHINPNYIADQPCFEMQ